MIRISLQATELIPVTKTMFNNSVESEIVRFPSLPPMSADDEPGFEIDNLFDLDPYCHANENNSNYSKLIQSPRMLNKFT